jgi:hypothetical protein
VAKGRAAGAARLGSFEVWAGVMGGILGAAGVAGFLGNVDEQYREMNSSEADWHDFFAAWFAAYQERAVKPADLLNLALVNLPAALDGRDDRANLIRLGYALANRLHDVQGGLRLERAGEERRSKLYRLTRVAAAEEEAGEKPDDGPPSPAAAVRPDGFVPLPVLTKGEVPYEVPYRLHESDFPRYASARFHLTGDQFGRLPREVRSRLGTGADGSYSFRVR